MLRRGFKEREFVAVLIETEAALRNDVQQRNS
jgi:hypothetical protein